MTEPIIVRSGGYEAHTDGSLLQIRRANGVVVGEGRVGLQDGSLCVGEYTGALDEHVHDVVNQLLREHESDLVARFIVAGGRSAQA